MLLYVTATPKGHPGVWVTLVTIVMLYSLLNTFFSNNPFVFFYSNSIINKDFTLKNLICKALVCIKQGIADDDPEVMKFLPTLSIVHKIEEDL